MPENVTTSVVTTVDSVAVQGPSSVDIPTAEEVIIFALKLL